MEIVAEGGVNGDMEALYTAQAEKSSDLSVELNMLKLREDSLNKQIAAERTLAENSRMSLDRAEAVMRRMQGQIGLLLSSLRAVFWGSLTIIHGNKPLARSTILIRKPEEEGSEPETFTPRDLVKRAAAIVNTFPLDKVPQTPEWVALLEDHATDKLKCSVVDLGGTVRPIDLDCVDPKYFTEVVKVSHGSDFVLKIQ